MKALIVSSGPPSGLGPIAAALPIGSLPFLGCPLLAHQLERLAMAGATETLVAMHHLPHRLEEVLAKHSPVGMQVFGALERDPYGLADALRAYSAFITETTLVLAADAALLGDLVSARTRHWASGAHVTRLLSSDGTEGAAFLIEPLARWPSPVEGDAWWSGLAAQGYVVVEHRDAGHGYRVGTPDGYRQALSAWLPPGVHVDPRARIHPGATLVGPAWIGPGCQVGKEAQVGPATVLAEDVLLERGARVSQSVVLGGTRLGKATRWQDRLVWRYGSFLLGSGSAPSFEVTDSDEAAPTAREPLGESCGQVLDSCLALWGLVFLAPLMLLIAVAIYLDNPGPVLYSQLRVGQDRKARHLGRLKGRVFELYKFRTMAIGADQRVPELLAENHYGSGAFFKLESDPRITRLGHWLRTTSLDELPQLLNVVMGDMRLVGCRPLPIYEAEALSEDWQRMRFACPAGITGLWQISGRSDLSEAERMVLDSYYSVTRTFWSDWGILLKTLPALLLRRGAR